MKPLTPQQMRFCELYVKTGNASQSYLDAGYAAKSPDVARACAARLLTLASVSLYVKQLQKKTSQKHEVSKDRIISELVKVAFADMSEVVEIDDKGKPVIKKDANLNALDSISSSESYSDTGYSKSFSVKKSDKIKAMEMLCKLLGLYDKEDTESRRNLETNAARVLEALAGIRK